MCTRRHEITKKNCIHSDNRVISLIAVWESTMAETISFMLKFVPEFFCFYIRITIDLFIFVRVTCFSSVLFAFFFLRASSTKHMKCFRKNGQGDIDSNSLCRNHSNAIAEGKSFLNAGTRTKEKFVIVKTETVAAGIKGIKIIYIIH